MHLFLCFYLELKNLFVILITNYENLYFFIFKNMHVHVEYTQITEEKEKIVKNALFIGSIFGTITFLFTLFGIHRLQNHWMIVTDLIPLIILIITFIVRKKLSLQIQTNVIIACLFILFAADIYKHGVFADTKILFALIPLFSFLVYSYRKTIIIFIIGCISYLVFSFLYVGNYVNPQVDYLIRLKSIDVWIINLFLLGITAFVMLLIYKQIIKRFTLILEELQNKNTELENYKENLEEIVALRTSDLEAVNEELRASNEELISKTDIIKRKNSELNETMIELQETHKQLIQSEKLASIGILTAGIAHELNNPLNFISAGSSALQLLYEDKKIEIDENVLNLLNSIQTGVNRASEIVKSLNQLNRTNDSLTENCNITEIIHNCLHILQHEIKDRVVISINTKKDFIVQGNSGKLHQVFLNICHNSLQAIEKNGKIIFDITAHKEGVQIVIEDSGCGISSENLKNISNPFFTTKEPGKGTGLGLSIAYSIIYEHKGTIDIASEVGIGTKVIIWLPLFNT